MLKDLTACCLLLFAAAAATAAADLSPVCAAQNGLPLVVKPLEHGVPAAAAPAPVAEAVLH